MAGVCKISICAKRNTKYRKVKLTHTTSCVIMILRFVFVPVKQVKKFGFGEARKKNMRNMVPAFCEKLGHLE